MRESGWKILPGGGTLPHVDGPASWQAKNSTGSFHLSIPLPNGEWYDFFQANNAKTLYRFGKAQRMLEDYPEARNYIVRAQGISPQDPDISEELMTLGHQGSERDNIRASHHPPQVAGRHGLSGISPVYLFGLYQTKQADSDPHCNESKGRLQLLLQETTVEDKSPSEKAKYSIVNV